MLNRELQFVEDGVRSWRLVVRALLATSMECPLAFDRAFMTAFPA
jgi:hypothetical protein